MSDITLDDVEALIERVDQQEDTIDTLEDQLDNFRSNIPDRLLDDDGELIGPEEAASIADRQLIDRMEHWTEEDCEGEECERIREVLGVDPGHDHDDGETEESDGADESDETSADDESDESGGDDVETNVFGEPV